MIGVAWESSGAKRHDFTPFSEYSRFSDDTVMTLAVAHVLLEGGSYATALREFGRRYAHGFSLHAGVRCAADQRQALEHLCRYITRPAIAHERLSVNRAGQVVLKRVFDLDVERCVCGGKLKIIAAIEESAVIERILTHLGLSAQPPPRTPARRVDLFQAA